MSLGQMPSRRLWTTNDEDTVPVASAGSDGHAETCSSSSIFEQFATRPERVPLLDLISNSLVVGQEFTLTCLFLAGHRTVYTEDRVQTTTTTVLEQLQPSLVLVWLAFFLVVLNNNPAQARVLVTRKTKVRHRTTDGLLMAVLLRFLAAVLKTLTASFSTDTVHALAISGFGLHVLACDYSYANGIIADDHLPIDTTKRPAFQGGTLSLTAAFFATTLLASRLESNLVVYIFVSASVIFFALYPAARHQVAINTQTKYQWSK